ncbi:protein NEDD1-like [Salvia divinorum]|uniref:Protein NEDD1-like n=1 Tax=Salvia divinorum TaxID=28513 RepID=A0ABD1HSK0_SALDI
MNWSESAKVVAASSGDTVKLLDISENECGLTYSPSPGSTVNSVKWNHNNMVLASAGDDGKVSLWRRNGTRLWVVPSKNDGGGGIVESISTINFCNKGSRYLCSGGTGQVVRVWDLQSKRCIKWLKGHTDTITGVMCNCRDEHVASVSRKGKLIVHNLVSGAKASDLKDPQEQVLVALDYSRISRHLLVTAGDEGSIHLWDTTGHNPKASWSKQHTAPATGVAFSPTNDKIIGSVGLDMKLYTFDTGSKKPSSCIHHEAPFCSLAYSDDGLSLAATTTTGEVVLYDVRVKPQPLTVIHAYEHQAITSISWQRSKPVTFNKSSCTDETILLAGDVGDMIIMPDPLPSAASGFMISEQPYPRSSLVNPTLARLHAPHNNVMDDMEVFSPIVEVQPLTPSFDKLWDNHDSPEKDIDRLIHSQRFGLSKEAANHENPTFNTRSSSISKQVETESTSNPAAVRGGPRKGWGGERALEKFIHRRQSTKMVSRFAKPMGLMPSLHGRETSEAVLSSILTKSIDTSTNDPCPPRFSDYASPKSKKTGSETREDILNNILSNSQPPTPNGEDDHKISLQSDSGKSEETLASFEESIHKDMQNLHLEILRQFHVQEMGMSSVMRLILENQAEIMQEIQSLREQIQHFHHLL